jgi:hypothetical protein
MNKNYLLYLAGVISENQYHTMSSNKPKKVVRTEKEICPECGSPAVTTYYGTYDRDGNEEHLFDCSNHDCPSKRSKSMHRPFS